MVARNMYLICIIKNHNFFTTIKQKSEQVGWTVTKKYRLEGKPSQLKLIIFKLNHFTLNKPGQIRPPRGSIWPPNLTDMMHYF